MTDDTQYDLIEAIARQVAAEKQVRANAQAEWRDGYELHAEAFLKAMVPTTTFIGEDLRRYVEPLIGQPHHPNAWGAMAGAMLRGWMTDYRIRPMGMAPMRRKTSHARQTPLYEVTDGIKERL